MASSTLVQVGCGRMGSALLGGWLGRGWPTDAITVVEPDETVAASLKREHKVTTVADAAMVLHAPDVIVLAVKPQVMAEALDVCRHLVASNTLVISIAAGTMIKSIERAFDENVPIVRAMPNTPASIGRGVSVLCANSHVAADERRVAEDLLAAVGRTAWIDDEELMHAVTALSGSGPAYLFHMIEAMAAAGIQQGLPEQLAHMLARETAIGAGALLDAVNSSAGQLRENVTSPGGTTEAALERLMATGDLATLLDATIANAVARSKALAAD